MTNATDISPEVSKVPEKGKRQSGKSESRKSSLTVRSKGISTKSNTPSKKSGRSSRSRKSVPNKVISPKSKSSKKSSSSSKKSGAVVSSLASVELSTTNTNKSLSPKNDVSSSEMSKSSSLLVSSPTRKTTSTKSTGSSLKSGKSSVNKFESNSVATPSTKKSVSTKSTKSSKKSKKSILEKSVSNASSMLGSLSTNKSKTASVKSGISRLKKSVSNSSSFLRASSSLMKRNSTSVCESREDADNTDIDNAVGTVDETREGDTSIHVIEEGTEEGSTETDDKYKLDEIPGEEKSDDIPYEEIKAAAAAAPDPEPVVFSPPVKLPYSVSSEIERFEIPKVISMSKSIDRYRSIDQEDSEEVNEAIIPTIKEEENEDVKEKSEGLDEEAVDSQPSSDLSYSSTEFSTSETEAETEFETDTEFDSQQSPGGSYSTATSSYASAVDAEESIGISEGHDNATQKTIEQKSSFESNVRETHEAAYAKFRAGKFDECLQGFEEVRKMVVREKGKGDNREANVLHNLACVHLMMGHTGKAVNIMRECTEIRKKNDAEDHIATMDTLIETGIALTSHQVYDEALDSFTKALEILQSNPHDNEFMLDESKLLNNIGCVHYESGNYDDAVVKHEKAYMLCKKSLSSICDFFKTSSDPRHLTTSIIACNYAYSLLESTIAKNIRDKDNIYKNVEHVAELFEDALVIQKHFLTPFDKRIVRVLDNLGYIHALLGNYEVALEKYDEILTLQNEHLGLGHLDRAKTMYKMANIHMKLLEHQVAKDYFESILEIECVQGHPNHTQIQKVKAAIKAIEDYTDSTFRFYQNVRSYFCVDCSLDGPFINDFQTKMPQNRSRLIGSKMRQP